MVQTSAPSTTATTTPVVHAQSLTKVFGDFWMRDKVRAVDTLDLLIEPSQIFGLIGPNGSGKSTTIKMILGLLHKTSGRLAVFGRSPQDLAVKRRIGYLPEESYLYPFLNSRETLEFYGKLFGIERRTRNRRIDELLAMVGLDAVERRPIGQFSKGMQRRIGIAQALINDPEFLILDEPTSGLDPLGIRQVKDLILDLGRRGKTILLSSHLLSEVEDVCDSMTILYGGKKRAEGRREELLTTEDRTIIEMDTLDERQIASVRRYIEETESGHVRRISPARQSLESLFLSIVEQARAERAPTHGAGAGGPTAEFLRSGGDGGADREDASGRDLIDSLMRDEQPEAAGVQSQPTAGDERGAAASPGMSAAGAAEGDATPEEDDVLKDLLATDDDERRAAPASRSAPAQSASMAASSGADRGAKSAAPHGRTAPARPADVDDSVIDSLLRSDESESDRSS